MVPDNRADSDSRTTKNDLLCRDDRLRDRDATRSWRDEVSERLSRIMDAGVKGCGVPSIDVNDDRLGRFEVRGQLGLGGQGLVLRVYDPSLRVERAMKVPELGRRADVEQILEDARQAVRLDHPGIVKVHEAERLFDAIPYIIMDLCDGGSLADWLEARSAADETGPPLKWDRACGFLALVADAVDHAHREGCLHRDLKPGNILLKRRPGAERTAALDDYRPVVTDFGLAVTYDPGTGETGVRAGVVEGTRAYMAPEQFAGREVSPRSDIFSVGVILYELICGGRLYETADRERLDEAIRSGRWRRVRERSSDVPEQAARVIERCLQTRPEDRYPDAAILAEDLRRLARGELPLLPDLPWPTRAWDLVRRKQVIVAGLILLVIFVTGSIVGGMWLNDRNQRLHQEEQRTLLTQLGAAPVVDMPRTVEGLDFGVEWVVSQVRRLALSENRVAARNAQFALLRRRTATPDTTLAAFHSLLDASPTEWGLFAELYHRYRPDLAQRLHAVIDADSPAFMDPAERTRADKRRSAAVCVLLLEGDDSAWRHLRFTEQPQVRSFAIEALGPAGLGPSPLMACARDREMDASIRAGAVLALGQVPEGGWNDAARTEAVETLLALYQQEPDAGLHAACKWMLLKWARAPGDRAERHGLAARLAALDAELEVLGARTGFNWRIGPLGLTLVRLQILDSEGRLARRIEMSDCEITVAQFFALMSEAEYEPLISPTSDCPINKINEFDRARFCDALSVRAGIRTEFRPYDVPPEAAAEAIRFRTGWQRLPGYRMPTVEEFEVAFRGGAVSPRSFGYARETLDAYAVHRGVRDASAETMRASPVASVKPNALGLFDVLGNLHETAELDAADSVFQKKAMFLGFGVFSTTLAALEKPLEPVVGLAGNLDPNSTFRVVRGLELGEGR